jgi:hypothetical protein
MTSDGSSSTVLSRRATSSSFPAASSRTGGDRIGHRLVLDDLEDVLDELPERLVVGTGAYGRMTPDPVTLEQLRERGIEVEALPTDEAVRRYGALDPNRTAAASHLTC